jgi:hypothetical protein
MDADGQEGVSLSFWSELADTNLKKAGFWSITIGALDWISRLELIRDGARWLFGMHVSAILLASWVSPALIFLGFGFYALNRWRTIQRPLRRARELALVDSDPRPYLEIAEGGDAMFQKTLFVYHNRGGDEVHRLQVHPLKVGYHTHAFAEIPTIPKGEKKDTFPTADGNTTPFTRHNLLHWIVREWDEEGKASGAFPLELPLKVTATYEDFSGSKKFEVTNDLVFEPARYVFSKPPREWPMRDEKAWKIGAPQFRRIA